MIWEKKCEEPSTSQLREIDVYDSIHDSTYRKIKESDCARMFRFIIIKYMRLCYLGTPFALAILTFGSTDLHLVCGAFEREGIVRRADDAISGARF